MSRKGQKQHLKLYIDGLSSYAATKQIEILIYHGKNSMETCCLYSNVSQFRIEDYQFQRKCVFFMDKCKPDYTYNRSWIL